MSKKTKKHANSPTGHKKNTSPPTPDISNRILRFEIGIAIFLLLIIVSIINIDKIRTFTKNVKDTCLAYVRYKSVNDVAKELNVSPVSVSVDKGKAYGYMLPGSGSAVAIIFDDRESAESFVKSKIKALNSFAYSVAEGEGIAFFGDDTDIYTVINDKRFVYYSKAGAEGWNENKKLLLSVAPSAPVDDIIPSVLSEEDFRKSAADIGLTTSSRPLFAPGDNEVPGETYGNERNSISYLRFSNAKALAEYRKVFISYIKNQGGNATMSSSSPMLVKTEGKIGETYYFFYSSGDRALLMKGMDKGILERFGVK